MSTNRIATTSKSQVQSLAFQGIHVYDSYHQIHELVRRKFGDTYALMFAEPSPHKDGSAIDWYSPVQGPVQPLASLAETQQKEVRATILRMARDIQGEAADIKRIGTPEKITRGSVLELALRYPGDDCIYVIGGQPVMTCWGFTSSNGEQAPQDLSQLAQEAPTPQQHVTTKLVNAPVATPADAPLKPKTTLEKRPISWLWLLPLPLLLLLALITCSSFGSVGPLFPLSKPLFSLPSLPSLSFFSFGKAPTGEDTLKVRQQEEADLVARRDALEKELWQKMALCPKPTDTLTPPVESITPPPKESLIIPPKKESLDFLQGQWWCDRGLVNKSDKQPIIVIYHFDTKGQGKVIIQQKGKEDCEGLATAEMADSTTLRIHADRQVCPDGRVYAAEILECRPDASGKAQCTGVSADGTNWGGHAPFYRIK